MLQFDHHQKPACISELARHAQAGLNYYFSIVCSCSSPTVSPEGNPNYLPTALQAVRAAEESLRVDPTVYKSHGAGWVMGSEL